MTNKIMRDGVEILLSDNETEVLNQELNKGFENQEALSSKLTIELNRRIRLGASFTVEGVIGNISVPGTSEYREIVNAKLGAAQVFKSQNVTDSVMLFRDATNSNYMLTPDQMISLCIQSMQWYERVYMVAWSMKSGKSPFENGIPKDFTDDSYWVV